MQESSNSMYSSIFMLKKTHMIPWFYLKWTEFTRNSEFCFNFVLIGTKFTVSCEFGLHKLKLQHHVFSSMKIEEYMESEVSGIFWVKMVAKNIVLVSLKTHFSYMRVKVRGTLNIHLQSLNQEFLVHYESVQVRSSN